MTEEIISWQISTKDRARDRPHISGGASDRDSRPGSLWVITNTGPYERLTRRQAMKKHQSNTDALEESGQEKGISQTTMPVNDLE